MTRHSSKTTDPIDHDGLFKRLLTVFFFEFALLFLPDMASEIDFGYVEFLDKETFGPPRSRRRRRESDLVAKVRLKSQREVFILIHIENQASDDPGFPMRMYEYYQRLKEKYGLPVFPVVIFSYDTPKSAAASRYEEAILGTVVLVFKYTVIQLNRLSWRKYVDHPNPAATALMTKMQIAAKDRPKVKVECLRLLTTLKLAPDKADLIYTFVESYLKLGAEQDREYAREFAKLELEVKETAMEIISSLRREGREEGRREGMQEGLREGKEEVLAVLLQKRFSTLSPAITEKLDRLTGEQLDNLALSIFEFQSLAELEEWLSRQ